MGRAISLTLDVADIFQILDALSVRAESWEATEAFLRGEVDLTEVFVAEECHAPGEAADIARHFRDIIAIIEEQLK